MADIGSKAPRKPTVLHFTDRRGKDEQEEATVARINKIVVSRVDEALTNAKTEADRGREMTERPVRRGQ